MYHYVFDYQLTSKNGKTNTVLHKNIQLIIKQDNLAINFNNISVIFAVLHKTKTISTFYLKTLIFTNNRSIIQ